MIIIISTRSKIKTIITKVVIKKKISKKVEVTTTSRTTKVEVVEAKEGNNILIIIIIKIKIIIKEIINKAPLTGTKTNKTKRRQMT